MRLHLWILHAIVSWLPAWSAQHKSSLYAWRRESFPRFLIIIKYLCQCIMAILCLAGFITLRVERESFPRFLIIIKYLCQCIMAALRLAGFFTLRVVAGSISKMCFAGCTVALGVIFCLGIMSRAAGYRAVHEAYACAHVFANLQSMNMAHFMQSSLYIFFEGKHCMMGDSVKMASTEHYFLLVALCCDLLSKICCSSYARKDDPSQA
jgi:hypothetical protein